MNLITLKLFRIFGNGSYLQSRRYCNVYARTKTNRKTWESVIGLEVHAQINSESKLFSGAGTKFAAPVNDQVAFFDAALPGTLPVLNRRCVEAGVLTALALNCNLNFVSKFDRKHYFYADLPAGYQITQQRQPLATGGCLPYVAWVTEGRKMFLQNYSANITQLQLEQDSGKSLHDPEAGESLIDLNRAGTGLMEIVTEPDFRCGDEAAGFVRELQLVLLKLGVCDGIMAEGSMRVDASISIRKPGDPLGTRAEVKNVNSAKFLSYAIEYEVERQISILEEGGEITNETRSFDYDKCITYSMRDKEKIHDYRFMPEPNLPPLRLYTTETVPKDVDPSQVINVDVLRNQLPELPHVMRHRLQTQCAATAEQTVILMKNKGLAEAFEAVMRGEGRHGSSVASFFVNQLLGVLHAENVSITDSCLSIQHLIDIVQMLQDKVISKETTVKVLNKLFEDSSRQAAQVVEENDWSLETDDGRIAEVCGIVIQKNPVLVGKYYKRAANKKNQMRSFIHLCNLVLEESNGKSCMDKVPILMRKELEKDKDDNL